MTNLTTSTEPGSAPPQQVNQPQLGAVGWLRWMWRQLTSMRTALLLLLAVAIAALPGSVFPQRSIDSARTADWITAHPSAGPVLDQLGFFEVYASPWFAAIYLLLFISLIGCVVPRTIAHAKVLRGRPPKTPKRLGRLPGTVTARVEATPEDVLAAARKVLRSKRMRVHSHDAVSVSAEGGYVKEVGNLLFHFSLIGVIVGVAIGHTWGWKGDVIVPEGQTFANVFPRYDTFQPGPWVDVGDLAPFTIKLDNLEATFEEQVTATSQFGQPRDFVATVDYAATPGASPVRTTIEVNHPLETGGASVFLLGNGYAPKVTVKDKAGKVLYSGATAFLAQDNNYKSVGAIKVPAATPKQLGFNGFFLPTATIDPQLGPISMFPQALDPALALSVFEGELAPDGLPQSVYTLDVSAMTQVANADGTDALRIWLKPGESYALPGDRGSITFDGVSRFAGFSIRHDPGKGLTLVSALLALFGLIASLTIKRRRIFVRVEPDPDAPSATGVPGTTLITVAGMAKADDEALPEAIATVLQNIQKATEVTR